MTALRGTGRLIRLVVRRDRLRLPLWLGLVGGLIIASAAALPPLYPEQSDVVEYVTLFGDNPALVAFAGPGYGFDDPNLGVVLVNETQLWGMIGVALMSIFLLNRHTRAEEDAERAEVIRSSVVGRHAPVAAAVMVVAAANVILAVACGVAFVALGYGAVGSWALAGSYLAVGWVFCGITVIATQVASTGRSAVGIGVAALIGAFLLRAVGDIGENALRWLSPIGWAQGVRAFAEERWWALLLAVAAGVALVVVGFWLSTRRDLGGGLLPGRPGPTGSQSLRRPIDLAVRLQRGPVIGWAVGLFITGIVYGSIAEDIEEMISDNPTFADILAQLEGASITDSFFATAMVMMATIGAGYTISAVLRLRSEETNGRVEALLAAPIGRVAWALSHLVVALVGTVLILAAAGAGVGTAYAVVSGDASEVPRLTAAALALLPAVLVLGAVAAALFGWWPRVSMGAWLALGAVFVVEFLGEVLRLPDAARQLSPFRHLSVLPADSLDWVPFLAVLAITAVVAAAGLAGFRRRDLSTE